MKKMLEVLKPILTAAVLAVVAYGFLHYVSFNLRFGVPDLMKLQELAVKKLSAPSGVRQSWCQVGDNYWCQVGDGYAFDYFNLINFDRTAGTITVSRMDAVHSRIRHVADYMLFICFVAAGGILGGFFLFRRSRYRWLYLPELAVISLLFAGTVARQYRQLQVEYPAKDFAAERDAEAVKQLLRLVDDTEDSGGWAFRELRLFIGKKKNFGFDFAGITVGDGDYVYIVKDEPPKEQLNNAFCPWEKAADHVYRCRHRRTQEFLHGLRSKVAACRGTFVLLFLLCVGMTVYDAVKLLSRRLKRNRSVQR